MSELRHPALRVANVSKSFPDTDGQLLSVLDSVSFEVNEGELLCLVGPSGCGKSTLFNIVAGLLRPSSGSLHVSGTDITGTRGHVGYMMQRDLLLPWRTVADNIGLGLELMGEPKDRRREIAQRHLAEYGMDGVADAYPDVLSGGMRQRVALIRTLVMHPEVLLLDEPFSALDFQTRVVLEEELLATSIEHNLTIVLVTHDIAEAIAMADRIVVLSKRPGTVKAVHEVGLARRLGSVVKARETPEFSRMFSTIWGELDVQVSFGGSRGSLGEDG